MSTSLFKDIIFGPVHSRRLGLSLGVNLLPLNNKLCSFECVYCECGWSIKGEKKRFNLKEDVLKHLEIKLLEMKQEQALPDVITFAGNGEPTMHPDFESIIDSTIKLRDSICPEAKISVLSNATMLGRETVRRALKRVDNNILKLDSGFDKTVQLMDKPQGSYSVAETISNMKLFDGKLIVQTMFLRGEIEGTWVDNTTKEEVEALLRAYQEINPQSVMIYSLDRDTPLETLEKVEKQDLEKIAKQIENLNINCSVAG